MTIGLFEREMENLEDNSLHKAGESSETKRSANHRKLAARRAIEDHLEMKRLRSEFWDADGVEFV